MHILMIGDVIGSPGRKVMATLVPELRQALTIDLVIANGENAAGGFGLTLETAQELFESGVDVITSGNHIWDQKEILPHMDSDLPILRPLNYPQGVPGKGCWLKDGVMVVNLMGRTFMQNLDCPFRTMDRLLEGLDPRPKVVVVDFHAEATSEKGAMGWYLDGRVSAVLGTHTHVGTIDARILPRGTAFVSDVGMVGPSKSIIGDEPEAVIQRFLTQMPRRLAVARGSVCFNSILLEISPTSGRACSIQRIDREVPSW